MRRWLAVLLALWLALVAVVVVAPAEACACGGVVDQPGGDTSVSGETAVVVWDGTQETILLRLSTRSEAVTAGLLVPTPTPATVNLGEEQVFTDLAAVTVPRTRPQRVPHTDVVADVVDEVRRAAEHAARLGVKPHSILLDPTHDFGKNTYPGLELLRRVEELDKTGWPELMALSWNWHSIINLIRGRSEGPTNRSISFSVSPNAWATSRSSSAGENPWGRGLKARGSAIIAARCL
jgi:hypothetical protein